MSLVHLHAHVHRLCQPTVTEGWCSEEKARHMVDLILSTKPLLVVEIGVFGGRSLLVQALALRHLGQGMCVGVDPWTKDAALAHMEDPIHRKWWEEVDLAGVRNGCLDHITREGLSEWCTVFVGTSKQFYTLLKNVIIPQPCIDILHIDGNHSDAASTFDSTHFVPIVRPGGHIWVDDPGWSENDKLTQTRTLDYLSKHTTLLVDYGSYVLYRKD